MTGGPSTSSAPAITVASRGWSPHSQRCPSRRLPALDVDTGSVHAVLVRHIPHGSTRSMSRPNRPTAVGSGAHRRGLVLRRRAGYGVGRVVPRFGGHRTSPAHAVPRDLWRWRIDLDRVALLDDDTRLARVGLPPPQPTQHQWPACQQVGAALPDEGYDRRLVASAARPSKPGRFRFRISAPGLRAAAAAHTDRRRSCRTPGPAHVSRTLITDQWKP